MGVGRWGDLERKCRNVNRQIGEMSTGGKGWGEKKDMDGNRQIGESGKGKMGGNKGEKG